MLQHSKLVGFIATALPTQSRQFYTEILGLTLIEDTPYAIVLEANNTVVRVQKTEQVVPTPYTSLGWVVEDIQATVRDLIKSGVKLELFDGLEQDDLGIWQIPGGASVAWFKDPDGNLLSLTQTT